MNKPSPTERSAEVTMNAGRANLSIPYGGRKPRYIHRIQAASSILIKVSRASEIFPPSDGIKRSAVSATAPSMAQR